MLSMFKKLCVCACVAAELFSDVKDTSAMAYSVSDSDGVCFVPSFSGLQVRSSCGSASGHVFAFINTESAKTLKPLTGELNVIDRMSL